MATTWFLFDLGNTLIKLAYERVLENICRESTVQRDDLIDILEAPGSYRDMERGAVTFWEMWHGDNSLCHAWSASPVYHLSQQILGVESVEPGWKRVRIAPLPGKLDFARGVIPSPAGPIRVEWEKVEEDQLAVRVDLPEGMTGEFVSPLGATRQINPGKNEFQT